MRRIINYYTYSFIFIFIYFYIFSSCSYAQQYLETGRTHSNKPTTTSTKASLVKEPVIFGNETLFYIADYNFINAKKRAKNVSTAIFTALQDIETPVRAKIFNVSKTYEIYIEDEKIVTVKDIDAIVNNLSVKKLAKRWKAAIDRVARKCDKHPLSVSPNPPLVDVGILLLIVLIILALSELLRIKSNKYVLLIADKKAESISNFFLNWKKEKSDPLTDEQIQSRKDHIKEKINKISLEINNLINYFTKVIQILAILGFINYTLYRFPETNYYVRDFTNLELSVIEIIRESISRWIISPYTWESFGRIILIIFITILLFQIVNIVGTGIENILNSIIDMKHTRETRIQTLSRVIRTTIKIILVLITIVIVLSEMGLNITPILAGAGIIGLAISFGAQSLVKDIINGIFILLEDQFGIGDVITVDTSSGVVENMTLRITVLRDLSGNVHIIPNGQITKVTVATKNWARANIDISIAYKEDIDTAIKIIKEVAEQMYKDFPEDIISEPQVLGVDEIRENIVTIKLIIDTNAGKQWFIGREYRRRVKYALDAHNIQNPYQERMFFLK